MIPLHPQSSNKPYEIVGAGPLVSSVWKHGGFRSGWRYRFNIFRMSSETGQVLQLFRPEDVPNLVKLCQVLAIVLADDACIRTAQRSALASLAEKLDPITRRRM